jgi:RNA polymerase sigma-70 factor (ECF subfamily)
MSASLHMVSLSPHAAHTAAPHREPVTIDEDADAMARLAAGEISALGEIYDRHHVAVRRFIVRLTGNTNDVDDLVHTTFLTVREIAASFDPTRSCRAWLLGIAAKMIRRHRSSGARLVRFLSTWKQSAPSSSPDAERMLAARDDLKHFMKALYAMSEAKRVVLMMADVEGLKCDDIAAALDIPIGTVWRRLHDARRTLASTLGDLDDEEGR